MLLISKLIKPRQKNGEIGVFKFAHGIVRANRIALVNHFIFLHEFHSYLEIGVRRKSDMYDKILTSRKVSVDPDPNAKAEFIMTSDEYFTTQDEKFDIIMTYINPKNLKNEYKITIKRSMNTNTQ